MCLSDYKWKHFQQAENCICQRYFQINIRLSVINEMYLFELDFLICTHAQFKLWPMTFMQVRMIHQFDSEAVRPLLILNMWVCLLNSRIKWFLQIRKLGICLQQLQVLHLSDSVIWNLNFVIYINLKVNLWRSCKTETASFYSLLKDWSQVSLFAETSLWSVLVLSVIFC